MRPGDLVAGRFAIVELAGAGGMGEVYRAIDRLSGETVALKVGRGASSPEAEARFEQEALALAGLRHPAIVRYLAHGAEPSGERYLAMEWLDGEDLGERLRRGALTVDETRALGARVAGALGAAHAAGVVHRDLKPSNLFLAGGEAERVVLLDFGIARLAHAARATRTGVVLGTPGYMAPEQARGERALDARADVFSLGTILFECLTGLPAFAAADARALLVKILVDEAPRVRSLRPEVPAALDDLVARMLAKDPADRPEDGARVAGELGSESAGNAGDPARPAIPALTRGEQRLVCVVLAAGDPPAHLGTAETVKIDQDTGLRRAVEARGGRFDRLADGSVVATLSGAGIATDQAAHAARCALALRALLPDRPIALCTGRSEIDGRVPAGQAIERAALRLQMRRAAPPAEGDPARPLPIDVDEVTAGLLDGRFEVASGELHGERAIEGARTLLGKPTEFVGRERELAVLDALFAECEAEPIARAVLVTAPAGVGKSRLAHEEVQALGRRREGVEIWIGRGDPAAAGSAFGVLGQAVRRAAGIAEGEPAALQWQRLVERVARRVPAADRARVAELLGELCSVPAPAESVQLRAARRDPALMSEQIRRAWEDFLRAELGAGPVVLVLDDLHWGDRPSVRLVDAALRALRRLPLFVIGLGRPEVHELFPRLWADRGAQEIRLGELTPRASEKLVRQVLGDGVGDATLERIVEQADGHAFFLEELIRAVAEGRREALPETVRAMVQARLEALPLEARRVLRAASVFGDAFGREGLRALLGGAAPGRQAGEWLDVLCEREILVRVDDAAPLSTVRPGPSPRDELAFRHALLRDGAYAMLTDADRALGHRLAASFLEQAGESDAVRLAEHFERGGEPARAAAWYLRAAERTHRGGARREAIALAERGLASGAEGEVRAEIEGVLAEAHGLSNDWSAAARHADEALSRARAGSRLWTTAIAWSIGASLQLGDLQRITTAAFALGAAEPDESTRGPFAVALAFIATTSMFAGQIEVSDHFLARMEQVGGPIEAGDPVARGVMARARADRARSMGQPWEALGQDHRSLQGFEEAGDVSHAVAARSYQGMDLWLLGAYEQAEEVLRAAVADGDPRDFASALGRSTLGGVLADVGRLDEAVAELGALVESEQGFGNQFMGGMAQTMLAHALWSRRDFEAAERAIQAAARRLELTPGAVASQHLAVQARIALSLGRVAEALAAAEASVQSREGTPLCGPRVVLTYLALGEARLAAGDEEGARSALRRGRERLLAQAADIGDPGLRQSFLERVPEHAGLLALAAQLRT